MPLFCPYQAALGVSEVDGVLPPDLSFARVSRSPSNFRLVCYLKKIRELFCHIELPPAMKDNTTRTPTPTATRLPYSPLIGVVRARKKVWRLGQCIMGIDMESLGRFSVCAWLILNTITRVKTRQERFFFFFFLSVWISWSSWTTFVYILEGLDSSSQSSPVQSNTITGEASA